MFASLQERLKSRKFRLLLIGILLVICGLVLGGLGVFARNSYELSRIAGVRDLEKIGFDCEGKFVEAIFYQATCTEGGYSFRGGFGDDDYGEDDLDFGSLFEPYDWIWKDTSGEDNQYLQHGGTRQTLYDPFLTPPPRNELANLLAGAGGGNYSGWSLQLATGSLESAVDGDGWDVQYSDGGISSDIMIPDTPPPYGAGTPEDIEGAEEEAEVPEYPEAFEGWQYAGPFSSDVVCDDIVRHVPKRFAYGVFDTDVNTSDSGSRAVVEIPGDFYESLYVAYCVEVSYRLNGVDQKDWVKFVIPLEELWEQIRERHEELGLDDIFAEDQKPQPDEEYEEVVIEESDDAPSTSAEEAEDDAFTSAGDFPEEPAQRQLFVKTFKDKRAKDAYFTANIAEHPCSARSASFVIDSDLAVIYSPPPAETDAEGDDLGDPEAEAAGDIFLRQTIDDLSSEEAEPVGDIDEYDIDDDEEDQEEDEDEIEPVVYNLRPCVDVLSELEEQALSCQASERKTGICTGGVSKLLLRTITAVAEDCQRMYDKAASSNINPTPEDLADCLQLTDDVRTDFIESIQIIGDDDDDYGKLLSYIGYYRFDTDLPYVLWDDWTEKTLDDIRFQFELVSLHEYMHKIYSQDLTLKDRMRFHRELLLLYESDKHAVFDYLGEGKLSDEVKHRINRHGSATPGLRGASSMIDEINNLAPEIMAILPEDIKEDYDELLNDRYGIVAFVYALAEAQVYTLFGENSGFESENLIEGMDSLIEQGRLSQIYKEYSASSEAEYDELLRVDPFLEVAARMPLSIRHDGDATLFGFNFEESETDIIKIIRDSRQRDYEEVSELEQQLLDKFRASLQAGLAQNYARSHKRVSAVVVEFMSGTFLRLISMNTFADSDEDLIEQIVAEVRSEFNKVPLEDLDAWEQAIINYDDSTSSENYEFYSFASGLADLIIDKYGGIDSYLLYDVFFRFNGFFAESYPILALETPAHLSGWLNYHYSRYVDRDALAKYFKYYPELRYGFQ